MMSKPTQEEIENMPEISIKGYTFELLDRRVSLFLNSKLLNIYSYFFKSLNKLEDWDKCYDELLRESIILNTGIIDPIQVEKILNTEKAGNIRFSGVQLFDIIKIKDFYLVERRNKMIENILKN